MMNKPVAVIRHISVEGLGTIQNVLADRGIPYIYIDTWKDRIPHDAADYRALIILGGPMGVYEQDKYPFIEKELSLIRKARDAKLPVIGICLGSQMVAQALGGRVYKGGTKEIGWYDIHFTSQAPHDSLFASVEAVKGNPATMKVFQWHGDTFDLPGDAVVLAGSQLYANQAFRIDTIYGLQFHIEIREADIKAWIHEYKAELDTLKTSIDVSMILEDTKKYSVLLNKTSKQVFTAFSGLIL